MLRLAVKRIPPNIPSPNTVLEACCLSFFRRYGKHAVKEEIEAIDLPLVARGGLNGHGTAKSDFSEVSASTEKVEVPCLESSV